ncbi:MAG: (2Fe-2S) ferredoxin domain-containing protein [Bdellovibrio sp.]|nr:(2Fe-2S) ferredoxin domain-containing protein [Bdellovibrio sp.]
MKKYQVPWEVGSLFICTKCGAKYNEPELAENVKKQIRKDLKEQDANKKVRVITSGCLNICYPEEQTFAFMPSRGETEVYTTKLDDKEAYEDITKFLKKKI